MTKVAINGLGRIGRAALKVLIETPDLELVAVNDVVPAHYLAYLLNFDSVYGKLSNRVSNDEGSLYVNGKQIRVLNVQDPSQLPWREMGIDIVLECTGKFTRRDELEKHLHAGAQNVILSAPSKTDEIVTVVNGVNVPENENDRIISCASSTTNCVAPIIEILGRRIGVKKAMMTSMHALTSSQSLMDDTNKDMRRGRAATDNFVPTSTGAARATTKVLPQFTNRFDGLAVRGPVSVGSLADITFVMERHTSVEEINRIFCEEAGSERYIGILGVNIEPIVSSDIIQDSRASVVDLNLTQVVDGDLVKVMSWYDNEWGFACQMIRVAKRVSQAKFVSLELI
jgi:glyceraldehyde 3-phosphate dehydrogenase